MQILSFRTTSMSMKTDPDGIVIFYPSENTKHQMSITPIIN
jgi:hypothetical protein